MTRSRRRLTAGFALAALAYAHGAIAAYGCLQGRMPEAQPQMACEEQGSRAPSDLLCRVHFQSETQTLDLAKVPQLSASDALVLATERAAVPVASAIALPARFAMAKAPPPPLNLLYSRFLI